MSKRGAICTGIGLLLLAAALFLTAYNLLRDAEAGKTADTVLAQLAPELAEKERNGLPGLPDGASSEEAYTPDYLLNPDMDMPEEAIDGQRYIGVLRIPALSLTLPVIGEWSYPRLKLAPCRYTGSVYQNDLVIAAHNYASHFGHLKNLSPGDEVSFTDMDGNVFRYRVTALETLSPFDVEAMTAGDWDLTLFTCTIGGQSRVTVRCALTT